jgi:pyruvate formate lyase activating enzyme
MLEVEGDGMVKVGSRFDLRTNQAPDAPETEGFEGPKETHGWVHSYETGSTVRAYGSCCSCPAASCAASIATTRTPGT